MQVQHFDMTCQQQKHVVHRVPPGECFAPALGRPRVTQVVNKFERRQGPTIDAKFLEIFAKKMKLLRFAQFF